MHINGVRKLENTHYTVFYIDSFSEEFKQLIRSQLQGIYNGFSSVDILPEFYSYKNTLSSFLDRYRSKSEDTQKGMIAELLAHILLSNYLDDFTCLSILKNKEERSIKKGFDIIYCHITNRKLWYSEVKSGKSDSETSTEYNTVLLDRAKSSIWEMILNNRQSLWESALIDVSCMIRENEGKLDLLQLLSNDSPTLNLTQRKNVILISTLYHELVDEIEEESISTFLRHTINEDIFEDVIVISIQKKAFVTVADFLESEVVS